MFLRHAFRLAAITAGAVGLVRIEEVPAWSAREEEDPLGKLLARRVRRQLAVLHDAALRLRRGERAV